MSPRIAGKPVSLLNGEKEQLELLYEDLGAWTLAEAQAALGDGRLADLLQFGVLGQQDTEMGPMLQLLATGRRAVYGKVGEARSLVSQLDRAYVRLSAKKEKWLLLASDDPFAEGLTRYAPNHNLQEAYGLGGRVLLGGKLSDGGYSESAIRALGRRIRSQALSKGFRVVLLTPSPRRGRKAAEEFKNFLELYTVLPIQQDGARRFRKVPQSEEKPGGDGPILTEEMARLRSGSLPPATLKILQLPRQQRINTDSD
ncbi:hypothetical protein ACINK0_07115 [Deinococcus sp. VB343]|uniref:hypothetical protein n=1 Tax=Deinococcus sp. VB343 TaxID=3385567 RepID=UPI0039C9CD84